MKELENPKFILEKDVPKPQTRTNWYQVFKKIPNGESLKLSRKKHKIGTVKQAFYKLRKHNFPNHYLTYDEEYIYVVNPRK